MATPTLRDDFARADTAAGAGLGVAPTGQAWYQLGNDLAAVRIVSGRYTTISTLGTIYQGIDVEATPIRMEADISFAGTYGPNSAVAILNSNGLNGLAGAGFAWLDMVHPAFGLGASILSVYVGGIGTVLWTGFYPNIPGATVFDVTFNNYVLKADGTVYNAEVLLDLASSTVTMTLKWGDSVIATQAVTDARFAAVAGRRLIWQHFLGLSVDPTQDVIPRFEWVEAETTTPAPTSGTTRRTLRRAIGRRLGDVVVLTATEHAAATDVFTDDIHVRDPSQTWRGRWAYYATAATASVSNLGTLRRVAGSSQAGKFSVTPPWPAMPRSGDVVEIYNDRNQGWSPEDIHEFINTAVRQARKLHRLEVSSDVASGIPVVGDDGAIDVSVAIPATWTDLFAVEYRDTRGDWQEIAPQTSRAGYGFRIDEANGAVLIGWREVASVGAAATVRLRGYVAPAELTTDESTTSVDEMWLVEFCMAQLLAAYDDGHPDRPAKAYAAQREASRLWTKNRTRLDPNTIRVRP